MLPVGRQAQEVLEMIGLPAVADLIVAGHSQAAIANTLGVSQSSLAGWLCNQRGPGASLYSEALRASAESMLDQAYVVLEQAELSTPGVMKARCIADLLIRKAGIRNKAYRDRVDGATVLVDAGGTGPAQPPTFYLTIAPQLLNPGRTFDVGGS
jgi:predicted transcriptional regulator